MPAYLLGGPDHAGSLKEYLNKTKSSKKSYLKRFQSKIGKEVKMKRLSLISVVTLISVFVAWLTAPIAVHADQLISVSPLAHNFGVVEVDSSPMVDITISNMDGHLLMVHDIHFMAGSDPEFIITTMPALSYPLTFGESVVVAVTFSPSSSNYFSATLEIVSNDPENPSVLVELDGWGWTFIGSILEFFDLGVEAGTIQGTGPHEAAKSNHLKVFEWKLLMVAFFLENGADREACTLLWHAYERSDGQRPPKDFIQGNDVPELNTMILQLITDLGCE